MYCVIIRHPFKSAQKVFIVVLCEDPFLAVTCYNQRRAQAADLRDAAPFCYPERVAGPMYLDERAKLFAHKLVHGTRGLASVCRRMEALAAEFNIPCYSPNVPLPQGQTLGSYLAKAGAPAPYLEAVELYEEAAMVLLMEDRTQEEGDAVSVSVV
jgi:hypothetical protein